MLKFIPVRGIKVGQTIFTSERAGDNSDDYLLRAGMIFAGAMYPSIEVSRYGTIFTDSTGKPLDGKHVYTLRFEKDQFPAVTDF